MPAKNDMLWKYAPLWSVLAGATLTMTKSLSTRYLLQKEWNFRWTDAALALGGAMVSYAAFRVRHGDKHEGSWYKR